MAAATERPRVAALLALFLAAALGVLALYGFAVRTEAGQDLDAAVYEGHELEPGLGAGQSESVLRTISVGTLGLATIGIVALAMTRRRPGLAWVPVAVITASLLSTELLKHVILERPDLLGAGDTTNSYPSGHTTVAISVGVATMLVAPPWLRPAAALGTIAYASAVGVGTVAAGWHRPSDVLGAYLVTIAIAALVVVLYRRLVPPDESDPEPAAGAPLAISLGVVLGLLAAFAIGLAAAAGDVDWTTVDRGFLASAVVLPASAAALVALLAAAVWGPSLAALRGGSRG